MRLIILLVAFAALFLAGCGPTVAQRQDIAVVKAGDIASDRVDLTFAVRDLKAANENLSKVQSDHRASREELAAALKQRDDAQALARATESKAAKDQGIHDEELRVAKQDKCDLEEAHLRWWLRIVAILCGLAGGILYYEGQTMFGKIAIAASALLFGFVPLIGREWLFTVAIVVSIAAPSAYAVARGWIHGEWQAIKADFGKASSTLSAIGQHISIDASKFGGEARQYWDATMAKLHHISSGADKPVNAPPATKV